MGKIISFLNFKGGVGKSTSTVNVAKALHDMGHKVLVVDADAQGNASKMMGHKGEGETLYDSMVYGVDMRNCVYMDQDNENSFDYIPSDERLSMADVELISRLGRERILSKAIRPILEKYDFILIDCAPVDGTVTLNAMTASDYIIVPLNGEPFAVDGMGKIIQRYREVQEELNRNTRILGYVFTLMRKCSLHDGTRNTLVKLREKYGWPGKIFQTEIKQNVCLAESGAHGTNVFDYARQLPDSNFMLKTKKESSMKAAEMYKKLAIEIIDTIGYGEKTLL